MAAIVLLLGMTSCGTYYRMVDVYKRQILGYPQDLEHSYGTVRMEIGEMQEGDVAGLAVFQDPYAFIGVKVIDAVSYTHLDVYKRQIISIIRYKCRFE